MRVVRHAQQQLSIVRIVTSSQVLGVRRCARVSRFDCHVVQVMLEEAVAIVMSPRDSQNRKCGIFRLTTPGGMGLIKDCSQTGFHTHPPTRTGQKIYELCGHVRVLVPSCV